MSKLGIAIAGTLATEVIGAGAIIGYQQLSNNSNTNSNTNSNVSVQQANSFYYSNSIRLLTKPILAHSFF